MFIKFSPTEFGISKTKYLLKNLLYESFFISSSIFVTTYCWVFGSFLKPKSVTILLYSIFLNFWTFIICDSIGTHNP